MIERIRDWAVVWSIDHHGNGNHIRGTLYGWLYFALGGK